mmetsp:Transcript_87058/g.251447  ORF Transcript_87058/g.251447 Transcript_87058/m.251447 type:complete len:249 (+) Transcript_87058:418-1164(+)
MGRVHLLGGHLRALERLGEHAAVCGGWRRRRRPASVGEDLAGQAGARAGHAGRAEAGGRIPRAHGPGAAAPGDQAGGHAAEQLRSRTAHPHREPSNAGHLHDGAGSAECPARAADHDAGARAAQQVRGHEHRRQGGPRGWRRCGRRRSRRRGVLRHRRRRHGRFRGRHGCRGRGYWRRCGRCGRVGWRRCRHCRGCHRRRSRCRRRLGPGRGRSGWRMGQRSHGRRRRIRRGGLERRRRLHRRPLLRI